MAQVPGLNPNIRMNQSDETPTASSELQAIITNDNPNSDNVNYDSKGNIISIEHPDGTLTISTDGKPLGQAKSVKDTDNWFRNLVEDIDESELNRISEDLLRGIDNDINSRQKWIDDRTQGLKLLGLSLEVPNTSGASTDGAPVEGMSRIRHPLLLEAVLRFQANARSELLPTDGPIKIRNDTNNANTQNDNLSNNLEKDLNHFITVTASEYYPDTDRMLLMLGFGGTAFKKGYFCPLRNRPVLESVDANDLIVNDAASDLTNALRITHRVMMKPSLVKRLQILGVYRDISLSEPLSPQLNSVQQEQDNIQGIDKAAALPGDRSREIYECYCELDVFGFEHVSKNKITGLEIPYRVTLDVSTRQILSIVRNYNEDTKNLPESRRVFVKYTFVPGLGFYDIGLLHILGNTTNAITAAWRELLDAGMFANFPGFLYSDTGMRQNTNIFRVPPGGGAAIKTGTQSIKDAVMPLPYNPPQPAFMQLVENIAETGMRIGGTSEQQVGEGRADAPVGTTLALIDQATKVMNSVHKRMHSAQAEEFQLLAELFREHPESFWQRNKKPTQDWDEVSFLQALEDCNIVPQADPNTASHGQRVMKIMALKQLQAAAPQLYDPIAVDTMALQAIGWNNPEQFFVPIAAMNNPSPQKNEKEAELLIKKQQADSQTKLADAHAVELNARAKQLSIGLPKGLSGGESAVQQQDTQSDMMDAQAKIIAAKAKMADVQLRTKITAVEDQNRDLDRQSNDKIAVLGLAKDILNSHKQAETAIMSGLQQHETARMQAQEATKSKIAVEKNKPKLITKNKLKLTTKNKPNENE